ncbi:MAG: pilin [Candidatus Magasanikbacteria bacterium]|nr:pilin [Candidatus Magasanikbacteria bacterium]
MRNFRFLILGFVVFGVFFVGGNVKAEDCVCDVNLSGKTASSTSSPGQDCTKNHPGTKFIINKGFSFVDMINNMIPENSCYPYKPQIVNNIILFSQKIIKDQSSCDNTNIEGFIEDTAFLHYYYKAEINNCQIKQEDFFCFLAATQSCEQTGVCPNSQVCVPSKDPFFKYCADEKKTCNTASDCQDLVQKYQRSYNCAKDHSVAFYSATKPPTPPAPKDEKETPFKLPPAESLNKLGTDIPALIGRVIKTIMGVVGTLALIIFIYAGILWMTAHGNSERQKKAMDTLVWASIGILVILSSYALVNFIFQAFK